MLSRSICTTPICAAIAALTILTAGDNAVAATESVLYSFTWGNDGGYPLAGLTADAYGNLYGTTNQGGAWGAGVVFRVTPVGAESVLHAFTGGSDGAGPAAGLMIDAGGNLYGTTITGGTANQGVVFKLRPPGYRKYGWGETVLHNFTGGTDGRLPYAGLIADSNGNLYGTTQFGGPDDIGTVFKITPAGAESVLYAFTGGNDGMRPVDGLVVNPSGSLFGTTSYGGGSLGGGTIFELTPPPAGQTAWSESIIHSFAINEGVTPLAGLIMDTSGNLYGTTEEGASGGTVFELSPPIIWPFAARAHRRPNYSFFNWNLTVLHAFTGGAADGVSPLAGLAADASGNLYGTTWEGGPYNCGTVFKVAPNGIETVVYSFTCGNDGAYPEAGLVVDASGNLYGTTAMGGVSGGGVVFKIQP